MEVTTSDSVDSRDPQKDENGHFHRVCEFFSPLHQRWPLIQAVLLWEKLEISVVCFNVINVVFWVFITPRLQATVGIAILASLLWLIPPLRMWVLSNITSKKLSAKIEKDENDDSEDSCEFKAKECESISSTESKKVSYEDFCNAIAIVWKFFSKYWSKLIKIKSSGNKYKFYGLLVLIIVVVSIFYQRFPVANMLYLTVMLIFLWPSIVFYGIKDKITGKILKLFKPFLTQWHHSQTKRKRNVILEDHRKYSDLSDDDEDFGLNPSKETVLSSPLSVNRSHGSHLGPHDSMESSVVSTEGLEFPSLRRCSVESYDSDDFIEGLNFGSFNVDAGSHRSSVDSLVGECSEGQNSETTEHIQTTRNDEKNVEVSVPSSDFEQEVRKRVVALEPSPAIPLSRNISEDDLQSYEIVQTSEVDNDSIRRNNESNDESPDASYLASGVGYLGKVFGYS